MSNMDRKTALEILRAVKNNPRQLSYGWALEALDVAIHELEILCQKKPDREYYGQ